VEIKPEADSNDINECPHNDLSPITVCESILDELQIVVQQ